MRCYENEMTGNMGLYIQLRNATHTYKKWIAPSYIQLVSLRVEKLYLCKKSLLRSKAK